MRSSDNLRLATDYKDDAIEAEDAAWAVREAKQFVKAMSAEFMSDPRRDDDPRMEP